MKTKTRIIISATCAAFMLTAWVLTISAQSSSERQLALISQAVDLINDGIYIHAAPLLEEAAGYNAAHTVTAEAYLKRVYTALIGNRGFSRKYSALLEKQMNRRGAGSDVFAEAAEYYLSISRQTKALSILKSGIEKTGCSTLLAMYENNRYAFETTRTQFEYIAAIHDGTAQVQRDGLWGIARANGTMLIPCEYDKISTFSVGRAIAMRDGAIFAIDRNNHRVALLRSRAQDFGNLAENRIAVLTGGNWLRASGNLALGNNSFEQLGTYSGGYAAAKIGGRWGVIGIGTSWAVPPEYDGIIMDELGRSYGQGSAFVKRGGAVFLFGGEREIGPFEDARPFTNDGYAAVKLNGSWGFVNTDGEVAIDFVFDDAKSFSGHLAAVKTGELWGYINTYGNLVIEASFLEAKSFSNGHAPVLTERGWQIITLLEYK